jgi:dienelactone hydrolase
MLSSAGITCAVTETSRTRRDRETFGADREGWARAAFTGKTFLEDHADAIAGTEAAAAAVGTKNIWVFGFSLGGIHTVLAGGGKDGFSFTPSGIALGGVGSFVSPGASSSLFLPIIDTVPPEETLMEAAAGLRTGKLVSFYGSLDTTFPEDSCRQLVEAVPLPCDRKRFMIMEGVDHAFRCVRGIPSIKPLEMISRVMELSVF